MPFSEFPHLTTILLGIIGLLALVFFEAILEILFQAAAYFTALVILPALTLGRVQAETPGNPAQTTSRWYQVYRNPRDILIISAEMASLIGLLAWIVAAIVIFTLL